MDKKVVADVLETVLNGLKSGDEIKQKLDFLEKENEVLREAFRLISAPVLYREFNMHDTYPIQYAAGRVLQQSIELRRRNEDPLNGFNLVSKEQLSEMQEYILSQVRNLVLRNNKKEE